MKRFFALILAVMAGTDPAVAGPITVPGTEVTFQAPDGFTPLSKEEITLKFPPANAPVNVVGNARRTTTIIYEWAKQPLKPDQLDEMKTVLPKVLERMVPGTQWKEKKIVELGDRRWVYLEGTHDALDGKVHDIILFTSHDGRMLKFQMGAMEADFPGQEKVLRTCIDSIVLKKP